MIAILLMLSLQNTVDARGCRSEPGYFGAGDSIPGYGAISIGDQNDCAIKCSSVKGCVGWTFSLQNENEELRNLCWLVETDKNKGDNFDWVRGPPCNRKEPTDPSTVEPSTLEPTTVDPIKDESSID